MNCSVCGIAKHSATFPAEACAVVRRLAQKNGITESAIEAMAREHFAIRRPVVAPKVRRAYKPSLDEARPRMWRSA